MLLKTYRAPDLATALARAREELGPHALVLGTSEKPGKLGLTTVEVTVGVARAASPDPVTASNEPAASRPEPLSTSHATRPAPPVEHRALPDENAWQSHPSLRSTVDALVASGLTTDLARRFARSALGSTPGKPSARSIADAATSGIEEILDFAEPPPRSRCTFVVGPPGCGKTTTVAKLVARASVDERAVFFAQTDCDRIGAFEQAEIFSRYIGARVARIEGAEDLGCVLADAGDRGSVLIDTPGIGACDANRLDELLDLRRLVPEADVALLVPAGLHRREAARILDRFAPLCPTCVGFSRVDDAAVPGELVTALADHRLPLAFFTNGPSVPDDLTAASPHGLASLLLRSGSVATPSVESHTDAWSR